VVERWCSLLYCFDSPREEEERENPYAEKKNVSCWIQTIKLNRSLPSKEEGISSRGTEIFSIDCISVQELDTFLQTPEAALHAAHLFNLQDQRTKSQRACMVPIQEKTGEDGVGRDVIGLLEGPVIRGKGTRQSDLAQGRDKVGTPEEKEDVVELEQNEVSVVDGLTTVEGKQTLCVECLEGESRMVTSAPGSPFRLAYSM
uniref:Uncharacterized protein n=1 Tax=Amphiprion percula TaxID=161767 RepID=A0A3P8TPT4_AMPPE